MFQRLPHIAISLLAVVGAYWVYALLAVPAIDPPVKRANRPATAGPAGEHERSRQRYRDQLAGLFAAGSWELGDPKVVETDQGLFLFQDYKPLVNGRMEVKPCTVVMYSAASQRAGGKLGRPLVMFVPAGAELQFDGDSDTTRAEFGRLQGGVLRGAIRIESGESQPGAADEILIQTRDITITEQKVWTPFHVDFRFGGSVGSGEDLTIALAPSQHQRTPNDFAPAVGGVKSLELAHIDKLHLQLARGEPAETAEPDAAPAAQAGRAVLAGPGDAPLEIICHGAFRFDFAEQVASFEDRVDVLRLATTGESDQLNCERLLVYFASRRELDATLAAGETPNHVAHSIARIVAVGRPVVLRAPSIAATARAEYLEYNLQTRRILLRMEDDGGAANSQAAVLQYNHYEITSPYVEYEIPEDARRLGQTWAAGPGKVVGQWGSDHPQPFAATWGKELHIRPHEDQHVISLTSGATIRYGESDHFAADDLHVWLREVPSPSSDPIEPPDGTDRSDSALPRSVLLPDRILAQGNVRADSPQLAARAKRLEAWFRAASGDPAVVSPGGAFNRHPPRPKQMPPRDAGPAKPPRKLDVSGEVIRLQMLLIDRRPELDELAVEGQARLVEASNPNTAAPAVEPLTITGDLLQAQDVQSGRAAIVVSGQPALVAAHGMSISGGSVHLRQAENKVWIDGAGQMLLPPPVRPAAGVERLYENPELAGGRKKSPPIAISWRDRMIFDGVTAQFHGRIQVRGRMQLENGDTLNLLTMGERLDVSLTSRVDFTNPSPTVVAALGAIGPYGRQPVDVRQFAFVGSVYLENQTFRDREQIAFDRLWLDNLSIDQTTGRLRGDSPRGNPGECRRVQLDPGSPASTDANGAARPAKPPRLMSLLVTFRGGVQGNLHAHQIEFHDQVATWYWPVQDWTDETPPPAAQQLGEDSVLLTSDRLSVAEMAGNPAVEHPVELAATGNVSVTGQRFKARGSRLSYARAKDLLILDGDTRGAAELWQLPAAEGQKPDAIARHIEYRPLTGAISVSGVKSIETTRPRVPLDRTAKPPQPNRN